MSEQLELALIWLVDCSHDSPRFWWQAQGYGHAARSMLALSSALRLSEAQRAAARDCSREALLLETDFDTQRVFEAWCRWEEARSHGYGLV